MFETGDKLPLYQCENVSASCQKKISLHYVILVNEQHFII